jgi:chromosome segregation ATPase
MIFSASSALAYTQKENGNFIFSPDEVKKLLSKADKVENLTATLEEKNKLITNLEGQIEIKDKKIDTLTTSNQSYQKENKLLKDKADELDKQLELANEKIKLKNEQIAEYKSQPNLDFTGELKWLFALKALDIAID